MQLEIQVALNFIISYLYNKLPRRRVNIFGEELERLLKKKYEGHWYPEKPYKGSGFRCIHVGEKVDPVIEQASKESGLDIDDVRGNLPQDLSVWIDPFEVSYQIGEKGPVKVLYVDDSNETGCELDKEIKNSFNPEAQVFMPISDPASSVSSSPSPPFGHSAAVSPTFMPRSTQPLTFTTATFAATKFGSTKMKNSGRSNKVARTSPINLGLTVSDLLKQKAISSSMHSLYGLGLGGPQQPQQPQQPQPQPQQQQQQQQQPPSQPPPPPPPPQQQQQQQQQQKLSGWGNVSKPAGTTKSLLEIQQEEARQMQKQQQQQHQQHQQPNRARNNTHSNLHTSIGNSVWGSINTGPPNQWASDIVSSIWSNADTKNSNMGFWDDAVKEVGPRNSTNKNKNNASLSKSVGVSNRQNKKVEEEEKLLKLFQGVNKAQDGFTQWCEQMLHALNTANNLDVPTFVSFLKEVESPYEVHDYIRAYLGDTSEAKEFAKQFLERRAKQKSSQQRQQQQQQQQPQPQPQQPQQQNSVWGMNHSTLHSVFQTNQSNNQQSNFEAVQSGKKKKKQKMVRADPSLLGFSVNASSERLNMGEIETLDDY